MNPMRIALSLSLSVLLSAGPSLGDEAAAKTKVEEFGGQVLGIAQNVEGVRVLLPPRTFEGRVLVDGDLGVLKDLGMVVELDLKNTGITDAGLEHLSGLTNLKRLHLEKTKITDAGLEHMKGLGELEYLNLYGTAVTDAGLEHLKGLGKLRNLYLWQTGVSFEAAQTFHQELSAEGNENLEINLGWEKEILSRARLAALKAQAAANAPEAAEEGSEESAQDGNAEDPDFATRILPIFQSRCTDCHGEEKQRAGLRLDTFELVVKGSNEGAVVKAGDLIESALFQRITLPAGDDDIMPPKGDPLSQEQIALVKNWIASGAKAKAEPRSEAPRVDEDAPVEPSSVFVEYVQPIFMEHCVECHGEEKPKAGLRLDSLAGVLKGVEDEAVVVAGKPEESTLYQRITLPAGDDDIMPPKGDPLAKAQTDLIKLWIVSGGK